MKDSSANNSFVLGPRPPQIQLGFLEDEPLPPSSSDSIAHTESTIKSPDTVQVERKDSGYGGSVSRSSSLAAFSRGIRKVFWRNSQKDAVETFVIADPPVIDCGIPQDALDHEDWAHDLSQRLTLASAPDSVTAWLGQLQTDGTLLPESELALDHSALDHSEETFTFILNGPEDIDSSDNSDLLDVVEEMVFLVPQPAVEATELPQSKSDSSLPLTQEVHIITSYTPTLVRESSERTIRRVVSQEELNKPHPPLPMEALENKPVPSVPSGQSPTKSTSATTTTTTTTTTSPFNSIARKLTAAAELGFGRNSVKGSSSNGRRPNLQDIFTDTRDTSRPSSPTPKHSKERRLSSKSLEMTAGETLMGLEAVLMTSPEELIGDSYMGVKPISKRSNIFFKTLAAFTASEMKSRPQDEIRPQSEVLLSNSNLSPEEISAEIASASRSASLRSPNSQRNTSSHPLAPPRPLFYKKGDTSSATSLGEASSCGSESSAMDSADEWDGHGRMVEHAREQNARYKADLKDLQLMLFQIDSNRSSYTPPHSANTSTGSLSIPSVPPSPSRKETKPFKSLSKKDDYMSHRMSTCSPNTLSPPGKAKPRSKSRLSMTYGGGELEVVKHAKVFVDPLFNSLDHDKPFLPRANPLYQLLAHIDGLIAVSTQITQRLGDCVRDETWSDETSLIGTIFLDAKEPLSNFLKYGQSYGKGMKSLRSLLKSKRSSVSVNPMTTAVLVNDSHEHPSLDKRRSLPVIFALNNPGANSNSESGSNSGHGNSKPRSSHGLLLTPVKDDFEYERFLFNCAGGKETTSRFSLADLLILPIQRVTRYCLLLKDLKKHTDIEHDDYICIVHALEQVHTLALATNNVQPSSMRL
ncbi:hypothetical protein BGZ76_002912 [Entomortierella beljakovae]|nr:hypothetical protein BGZ76_002912 [Entomortierella beljakovae]